MTAKIVNLTEQLVRNKVDEILGDYPSRPYRNPYQKVFSKNYVRERIIAQVVNRSRNHYVVLQDSEMSPDQWDESVYSIDERAHMENLIHDAISRFVDDEMISHATLDKSEKSHCSSLGEPSCWFG